MKTLEEIKTILVNNKEELKNRYKVKKIGVFGSYVLGLQNNKSDIDILIDFYEVPDLFTYVEIQNYLTRKLRKKTDLVMKDALKPHIGKRILKEVIYV